MYCICIWISPKQLLKKLYKPKLDLKFYCNSTVLLLCNYLYYLYNLIPLYIRNHMTQSTSLFTSCWKRQATTQYKALSQKKTHFLLYFVLMMIALCLVVDFCHTLQRSCFVSVFSQNIFSIFIHRKLSNINPELAKDVYTLTRTGGSNGGGAEYF